MDEQLREQMDSHFLLPLVAVLIALLLAIGEWWRYLTAAPPAPYAASVIALAVVAYSGFRIARGWPRLKALRLGRDGERVVGQYLEQLRSGGYRVFHDLLGRGFNVDHVIVGESGVYTIETKTFSKETDGEFRVFFDGEVLTVAGLEPDRDPIVQAKAQAHWLRELIQESTGKRLAVRPVILFPGWFVEQPKGTSREVWVLNPKALPAFLENEPAVLSKEDVNLVSFHLSRFIREEKSA